MNDDIGPIIEDQFSRLLGRIVDRAAIRAAEGAETPAGLWRAVEEAGVPLALVSEAGGGIGLAPTTAFNLISIAAYHALPLPLGETMAAAGLLDRALTGPATLASFSGLAAKRAPYGADAAHVLCALERGWILAPASCVEARRGANLAGEPRDDLRIAAGAGEPVDAPAWLGPDGLDAVGALVRAAQMRGAMRRAVEMSLSHAREREQFGRPIARFQAVQHMLADAAGQSLAAGALVDNAAEAWGDPDFAFRAALAKSRAGAAAGKVAEAAHQTHAAMGFTQEHDLNFHTRRLWAWRDEFGGEALWRERIGRAVCAEGGEALWPRIVAATSGPRA
ncbi:acyl-CoA dehydrogenase family protein [Pikeienuella sp. HZG-20]|uniref:acyl-CoA dehydrogenase family protein n=1 Tax=Paludibacillus litoralis TaxID=3133267 RepID=UPI0030EF1262